jgi:hypothetical protein
MLKKFGYEIQTRIGCNADVNEIPCQVYQYPTIDAIDLRSNPHMQYRVHKEHIHPIPNKGNDMAKTQLAITTRFRTEYFAFHIPTLQFILPIKQRIEPLPWLYAYMQYFHDAGIRQYGQCSI